MMKSNPLPRLDTNGEIRQRILPLCRLQPGGVWVDPQGRHKVGCLDAANINAILRLMDGEQAHLAIHDPPYNLVAFEERDLGEYIRWCRQWVHNTTAVLGPDSSFYVWLGADQRNGFQPLPDFMLMMRETQWRPRSFITMRNQRGFGTQKNWMAVRQELLYYIKGEPDFNIEAEYTDIPKTFAPETSGLTSSRSFTGWRKMCPAATRRNRSSASNASSKPVRQGTVWSLIFLPIQERRCWRRK
jgi:site-specific DNA-methyltransferase (adenine-specific)